MASIRKRGNRWHVQVRRAGQPAQTRSFLHKADAERWARQMETEADRTDLPPDRKQLKSITVADLLQRYVDEVLPKKRHSTQRVEAEMLHRLKRADFARYSLAYATPAIFAAYRDQRLKEVKPASLHRELGLVQHAFETARREWDVPLQSNPVQGLKLPPLNNRRERRISDEELRRLFDACKACRNKRIEPLLRLALETGMRRSELVNVRQEHIDLQQRTLHIPKTKNGHARTVPLSGEAIRVFCDLTPAEDGRLFPMTTNAVRLAWEDLRRRAGVEGVRLHDLRHEAVSRFFERGLSVPEVALISGHLDYRMLQRYTHLQPDAVAAKL